ncbi:MAG: three-Cys-motif partner protein TcmP [Planctomycetota bacterium]
MTDQLPTIWPAAPHTLAKHRILEKYLQAWMAILSRQSSRVPRGSKELLYVDGFAGPGVYEGGEPGSPVVAIRTALDHKASLPVPVRFVFIEYDTKRFESLTAEIEKLSAEITASNQIADIECYRGDCSTILAAYVERVAAERRKFGPAMVFLDQFGYSQIPIDLVAQILRWPQCEVFSYLNWDHLNRYLTDLPKAGGITAAFGSDVWAQAKSMPAASRRSFLLAEYRRALKERAHAKFVLDFAMYDENDNLLYWLFFCTNSLRGIEEMKRAMWQVDTTGSFRFSDKDDPNQLLLLRGCDDEWLANELATRLAGRTMTVEEVKAYVLCETPCHLFKKAVARLERAEKCRIVDAPVGRRARSYRDDLLGQIRVRFV